MALEPDRCSIDHSRPCAYWHGKKAILQHGRNGHTDREMAFLGFGIRGCHRGRGWRYPTALELGELDPEDAATLQVLMALGEA